jgi:hypothetical protein
MGREVLQERASGDAGKTCRENNVGVTGVTGWASICPEMDDIAPLRHCQGTRASHDEVRGSESIDSKE